MPDNPDDLFVEQEAAQMYRWTVANMRKRRLLKLPPAWIKIGSSVRYQRKALEQFIHDGQQPVTTTTARPLSKSGSRTKEEK
jgi:hypothetical protein